MFLQRKSHEPQRIKDAISENRVTLFIKEINYGWKSVTSRCHFLPPLSFSRRIFKPVDFDPDSLNLVWMTSFCDFRLFSTRDLVTSFS